MFRSKLLFTALWILLLGQVLCEDNNQRIDRLEALVENLTTITIAKLSSENEILKERVNDLNKLVDDLKNIKCADAESVTLETNKILDDELASPPANEADQSEEIHDARATQLQKRRF